MRVSLIVKLVRRELRTGLRGFRVFFLCLVLGVGTIGAVRLVSSGIERGLHADGRDLLGGDIALRRIYRPADPQERQWLENTGRLSTSAHLRTMARSLTNETTLLIALKAVDASYPLFGHVRLNTTEPLHNALEKRDGHWGVVAEAVALERLGLSVGETMMIGTQTYRVRGVIDHEPDRFSGMGIRLGARVMIALDSLAQTDLIRPGSIIHWTHRLALSKTITLDAWRTEFGQRFQQAGWRVRDFTNAIPQLSHFIWRFTTLLTLVGLTSLLIGGVGISAGVRGYLETKYATLAIFKCLGAESNLIFWVFFWQILIIALSAILVGLVVSIAAAAALTTLLQDVLPGGGYTSLDGTGLALAAGFGLLTVLVFSIWPLAAASDVSAAHLFRHRVVPVVTRPRRAFLSIIVLAASAGVALTLISTNNTVLTLWFLGGLGVFLTLFRVAAWILCRGLATLPSVRNPRWRLALTNLYRPGNSTARMTLSLGLGLTVLVAVGLIQGNFIRQIELILPEAAPDFFFIDIQPEQYDAVQRIIVDIPQAELIDSAPSLRGRIVEINGLDAQQVLVNPQHAWLLRGDRGITFRSHPPRNVTIVDGTWWPPTYAGPPQLSIYRDIAEAFDIGVGDRIGISLLGRTIQARIANIRDIDFLSLGINFTLIFSPGLIQHAPYTYLATVRVSTENENLLLQEITQHFPNISAIRVRDALTTAYDMITTIGIAVRLVVALSLAAGILVLTGAIAADQRRRVYNAVIFKVLGATRLDLVRSYLMEYGLLGLVTALLAAGFGTIIAWAVLTQIIDLPWVFMFEPLILTITLAIGGTMILGFLGTWRALGGSALSILRNE